MVGQGVWFLVTHHPDNIIAAAPVSGYTSIESELLYPLLQRNPSIFAGSDRVDYVPYNMWRDSEPLISAILHQSRASFKHELLVANAAGIPILQQHGLNDTNVPVYHSRLMHQLLEETGWPSGYVELPHEGHWYDGVMATAPLLKFYNDSLQPIPEHTPMEYTMYIPSSGDMASKGGIYVDQLQSPDMFGRLRVKKDSYSGVWHIQTQNIYRFHLTAKICWAEEDSLILVVDDMDIHFEVDQFQCESTWYVKDTNNGWISSKKNDWRSISQRYGRQMGAMDAIMRTNGIFTINVCSMGVEETALQISRNLLQYFAADSHISRQCSLLNTTFPGNVITVSLGDELPNSLLQSYPIYIADDHIALYRGRFPVPDSLHRSINFETRGRYQKYTLNREPSMGALFLRPMGNESLELVVWGEDMNGLEQAARLVPTLTGAGQPEFLILGGSCRWKGHAGLYAAGHFDRFWQISMGSYIANGT